ncbi:DUF2637 domain-containing protein [Streptomyces sp. PA03-6a]|nr:DUF2637 domain-containing protein [Streptomyces sp. PA03-6a]
MTRIPARQWLAVGAAAFTVALTGAAFWLSYEHLHDVASGNGLHDASARAWAWPATVDMFIVVGELLILRASLAGRVDRWAIAVTAIGSGGSIALNVAGVGRDASLMEYVVAAVPPVAALMAFGVLMRQVHEALSSRDRSPAYDSGAPAAPVETVFERDAVPAPAPAPDVPALPPVVPASVLAAEQPRTRVSATVSETDEELIERTRKDFGGQVPTYSLLKEKYGIGQTRARRIRDVLESELSRE